MMVQVARNGPDGPIDIALHPEELGQIRFELTTTGNRLHITLFVERPESLDLFRRHINDLMTDIRQSGFGQTSLSFGNWSQREHQPAPPVPEGQAALRPTQTQQGWSDTDRGPAQTYDTGRLDLRL
ncbi:MAG: flagellar hook-length control protein FliK [Rhodobacteraceae bacterium]|nr:flagellar hook-length control protein FliK [Paracoccaceae bacterium]